MDDQNKKPSTVLGIPTAIIFFVTGLGLLMFLLVTVPMVKLHNMEVTELKRLETKVSVVLTPTVTPTPAVSVTPTPGKAGLRPAVSATRSAK